MNKIVYVLVSEPSDHYTEMALLSIQCVRQYSPGICIELVVDRSTDNLLQGYRGTVRDYVDRLHIIDISGHNNVFTSRMIKTQLRSIIDGDYLYIDIDAIPVDRLDDIFISQHDIAMVYDHNTTPDKFIFQDYEREIFDLMDWDLPSRYFNSGVMLVKDNYRVKDLFDKWHELWLQSSSHGFHKDQPSLHEAIRQMGIDVDALSPSWNVLASIQKGVGAKQAKIYHISTIRFESRNDTYFHQVIKNMKKNEEIDWNLVEMIVRTKYPWTNKSSIRLNLAVGNYSQLPKLIVKRLVGLVNN